MNLVPYLSLFKCLLCLLYNIWEQIIAKYTPVKQIGKILVRDHGWCSSFIGLYMCKRKRLWHIVNARLRAALLVWVITLCALFNIVFLSFLERNVSFCWLEDSWDSETVLVNIGFFLLLSVTLSINNTQEAYGYPAVKYSELFVNSSF